MFGFEDYMSINFFEIKNALFLFTIVEQSIINNDIVDKKMYLSLQNNKLILTEDKTKQVSSVALKEYTNLLLNVGNNERNYPKEITLRESLEKKLHSILGYSSLFENMFYEDINLDIFFIENTIPIPEDNVFFESELLVFKDEFPQPLPLNGIKQSDFLEISHAIEAIKSSGKCGSLQILPNSTNVIDFEVRKERFIQDLIYLCCRKTGREIINTIINQCDKCLMIDISVKNVANFKYGNHTENTISYSPVAEYFLEAFDPNYYRRILKCPQFIVLGHEMIHYLHFIKGTINEKSTIPHSESGDLEEFETMTGWSKVLTPTDFKNIKNSLLDNIDWDVQIQEDKLLKEFWECWDSKSENGLRSLYNIHVRTNSHRSGKILEDAELVAKKEESPKFETLSLEDLMSPKDFEKWDLSADQVFEAVLLTAYSEENWKFFDMIMKMGGAEKLPVLFQKLNSNDSKLDPKNIRDIFYSLIRCHDKPTYRHILSRIKEFIPHKEIRQQLVIDQVASFLRNNSLKSKEDREIIKMFFLEYPQSIENPDIKNLGSEYLCSLLRNTTLKESKELVELFFSLGIPKKSDYLFRLINTKYKKVSPERMKIEIEWLTFLIGKMGIDPNVKYKDDGLRCKTFLSTQSLENDDRFLSRTLALIDLGMNSIPSGGYETEIIEHVIALRGLKLNDKRALLKDPRLQADKVYELLPEKKKILFNRILRG